MVIAGHEQIVVRYGGLVYLAAERLYGRLRGDPAHQCLDCGAPRLRHRWNELEAGSLEFWCDCAVLVADTIHEKAIP